MKLIIKEIMKSKKITARKLAYEVNCTPEYISGIINGNNSPSLKLLEKIADVLNVHITDLFDKDTFTIVCPHCKKSIEYRRSTSNVIDDDIVTFD